MSDYSVNSFVARGTAAQRVAFTPSPPTPSSGPSQGYFWFETDTGDGYSWSGTAWIRLRDQARWKDPCRAKTTGALAANTYNNGTSGVGATLTGNANGALAAQDAVTLVAGESLLVANEVAGLGNGIYTLTQVGSAGTPYILTRRSDADVASELVNATTKISEGTVAADQEWQCTTNASITVGTTALSFAQAGGAGGGTTTNALTVNNGGAGDASSFTFDGSGAKTISYNSVGAAPAFRGASVHKSVAQTGANYSAGVFITWDSESFDSTNIHSKTATVTMTIASPCVVSWTAHGLIDGTPIVFTTTGALPTGLTAGTTYFVKSPATDTFNVAATNGGTAINTSGSQSGVQTATTRNTALIVPAGVTRVAVGYNLLISNATTSGDVTSLIFKNNGVAYNGLAADSRGAGPGGTYVSVSTISDVTAGDFFEVSLTCADTSVDMNANSNFWMHLLQ